MTDRTQRFRIQISDFTIYPLNNEHNVSSNNILVSTVDLVVTHFAHRCFGSAIAEEQLVPGPGTYSKSVSGYRYLSLEANALGLIEATLATKKRIYLHYLSYSYVGASRSSWLYGVPSSTEVRDLRGIPAAQGVDAVRAGHALLPVLPRGHGSQAETPSDLHVAELSATPGRATPFQRANENLHGFT